MALSVLKKIFLSVHFYTAIVFIALVLFPLSWPIRLPDEFWIKQVLIYLIWAGLFYANLFFLAPKLLYQNKVVVFVALLVSIMVLIVYANRWLDDLIGVPQAMARFFKEIGKAKSAENDHVTDYIAIICTLIIFGASTIIAVSKKIKSDQVLSEATEKDKISSELSFLKAQINPHFFFNILHTIYALSDSNSAAAKDAVYTLSHMMRYVIYETKNDLTDLEKEIKFAEDYIKLMKLRLTDEVQVIFEKPLNIKNVEIAPMLLLPFIENAFKHGISALHPSYVYIDISQDTNTLRLEVKNTLIDQQSKYLEESNGIGIANTRRRLGLLYPGRYQLTVDKDLNAKEYTVVLTLNFK